MKSCFVRVPPHSLEMALGSEQEVERVIRLAHGTDLLLDLDDAWCGLHFLLTGEVPITKGDAQRLGIAWWSDSLENAIMGGMETSYRDSYRFARLLSVQETSNMAQKLADLNPSLLAARFNPADMIEEKIPPQHRWREETHALTWLHDNFMKLRTHYGRATRNNDAMLIYIV